MINRWSSKKGERGKGKMEKSKVAATKNEQPSMGDCGSDIAFFDVETTVPCCSYTGYALLEFGAILVCPRRLVEVGTYSTLIRPPDLAAISVTSIRCNGISKDAVAFSPPFLDVADSIFNFLHGRVWAGHNIVRFDCVRIKEAFAEIGRPAPEPKGIIDTLPLLTQWFGRRAGDMKMASLASYFGLGRQRHRSLDDVRMNLEVLKYCSAVLFLESSLPDVFSSVNLVHNKTPSRTQENQNASPDQNSGSPPYQFSCQQNLDSMNGQIILDTNDPAGSRGLVSNGDPSNLVALFEQMTTGFSNTEMLCATNHTSGSSNGYTGFLEPDQVLPHHIKAPSALPHQSSRRISLLHRDCPLQLCCMETRIQFGVSTKFMDHAGRPKLSIVVDAPENLRKVLDVCDQVAQVSSQNSGSNSEWRPLLKWNGYSNSYNIRLHILTVTNDDGAIYSTEMYHKDPNGNIQKLVFSKLDASELDSVLVPGVKIDAYFGADIYDFLQSAGIRLVARRLVVHSR